MNLFGIAVFFLELQLAFLETIRRKKNEVFDLLMLIYLKLIFVNNG
jgi:hypothetical protein